MPTLPRHHILWSVRSSGYPQLSLCRIRHNDNCQRRRGARHQDGEDRPEDLRRVPQRRGAEAFLAFRSYLSTATKQGVNLLDAVKGSSAGTHGFRQGTAPNSELPALASPPPTTTPHEAAARRESTRPATRT